MIRNLFIVALLAAFFVSVQSCKNDLDLLADYKDTTIVYCVLNPSEPTQYVRIHKAYLGPGDALVYAQIPDSIYYKDILSVRLERIKNGVISGVINCKRDTSTIVKDPGTFSQYPNILYTSENQDSIYEDSEYRVVIHNNETGKYISAQTTIADRPIIAQPSGPDVNFFQNPFWIQWYPANDAKFYGIKVRFNYAEVEEANPTNFKYKYLDWNQGTYIQESNSINQVFSVPIYPDEFYTWLQSQLDPLPGYYRVAGQLDFMYASGNKDLYTYNNINNNTINLSQNSPTYTNFYGALGILASRNQRTLYDRQLNGQSLDSLVFGTITGNLGFK